MKVVSQKNKRKHPLGFHVCCITFVFERLAYYGARSILLLFLITAVTQGGLGMDSTQATVIAANLIAYTAIAPIVGGVISDRWIGARYSVTIGMVLMAVGYACGWFAQEVFTINLMILLVSLGTGLFRGNLNALIGCQYENGEVLDEAFSLQYSYLNIGAFLGSLITGYLYLHVFRDGDLLGFRQCFLVAAGFCILGVLWFVWNWNYLQGFGRRPNRYLEEKGPLTGIEKQHILVIIVVAVLAVIFWIFYFQQDLALVIYMTENIDMTMGSFTIPTTWLTTTWNGLLCIILGGVMAKLWKRLSERPQGDMSIFSKISLSFLFLAIAYGVMALCEYLRNASGGNDGKMSFLWPLFFVTLLTVGEMCFSPLRNALVSKYAPKRYLSLLMGVIASSSFFANKLSPYIQVIIVEFDILKVFLVISIILMIFAGLLWIIYRGWNKILLLIGKCIKINTLD